MLLVLLILFLFPFFLLVRDQNTKKTEEIIRCSFHCCPPELLLRSISQPATTTTHGGRATARHSLSSVGFGLRGGVEDVGHRQQPCWRRLCPVFSRYVVETSKDV